MKPIILRLPDDLAAELDAHCAKTSTIRMQFIRHAITQALAAAAGAPVTAPLGAKLPLQPIDLTNRETIRLQLCQYGTSESAYNATLAFWMPAVWEEYFHDLAVASNMTVSGVVMARIKRHMDGDDLRRYAEEKGWPTAYARRQLINHVFPELPYCEFDPAPARRVFAHRKRGG